MAGGPGEEEAGDDTGADAGDGKVVVKLSESRERFEGIEEYQDVRDRLQAKGINRPSQREVDRFMRKMKEWGSGKIAMAWRVHFDADGDGELTFKEFCSALASLGYRGDIPRLWADLKPNGDCGSLQLEDLDPEHASYLEFFGNWCIKSRGGPTEVFRDMDDDNSGSVTRKEFSDGLRELGFYQHPGVPEGVSDGKSMMKNLYPLLDCNGTGCITAETLLFLEKDKEKKQSIAARLARIRAVGIQGAPEPLANDAQRMLFKLSMGSTALGGKHWKSLQSEFSDVAWGNEFTLPSQISSRSLSSRGLLSLHAAKAVRKPGPLKRYPSAPALAKLPMSAPSALPAVRSSMRPTSQSSTFSAGGSSVQSGILPPYLALPEHIFEALDEGLEPQEEVDLDSGPRPFSNLSRRHHGFPLKVKGRKFFAIPPVGHMRL